MEKSKIITIGSFVFGTGIIILSLGAMTNFHNFKTGTILILIVWIISGSLIGYFFGEKKFHEQKRNYIK